MSDMLGNVVLNRLKKMVSEAYTINEVSITVSEYEDQYDVYANIYFLDSWNNRDFDVITVYTVDNEDDAEEKAENLAELLSDHDFNAKYNGIENA